MFCKECGTENNNDSLKCINCDDSLNSSNSPLTGEDRTKIIGFFAFLILPVGWFGASIVIILIAIFGLYIMKKDENFTPIINAKKYIKAYLILLALVTTFTMPFLCYILADFDLIYSLLMAGGGLVATPIAVNFFMFVFNSLFFKPLEEHQKWIIKNELFSDEKNPSNIFGRDNLSAYSIADEMLKWNTLLEKGLITNEEFEKAKTKLINGEK